MRPAAVTGETSFAARNRAFVLEMLGEKKRLEDYPDRVDPNLIVYEPAALPFGGTYTGIAEFTRFYDKVREYYDFSTWQLTDVVAEGDIVFSTSRVHIAKRNATMHIAERFRFRGTTLIEVRVFICDEEDGQR
ncbi:MAG TPA: nuclear transport factor 2 family protein [Steroidobacteraceae bacterium]|nr:nuclear transport factor 2 family protein [Steroidobacteraceae bacterium]